MRVASSVSVCVYVEEGRVVIIASVQYTRQQPLEAWGQGPPELREYDSYLAKLEKQDYHLTGSESRASNKKGLFSTIRI